VTDDVHSVTIIITITIAITITITISIIPTIITTPLPQALLKYQENIETDDAHSFLSHLLHLSTVKPS
jgi:hypothetical protein